MHEGSIQERQPHSGELAGRSFPVQYDYNFSNEYNLDLRGKGALTITPEGGFVFTGDRRKWFSRRTAVEIVFGAADVWNVRTTGRTVRFSTTVGKAGRKKKAFVFFCRSAEEAEAVRALLPDRKDADHIEVKEFAARIKALPGAAHPWSSVANVIVAINLIVFVIFAGFLGAGWFNVTSILPYVRFGANNAGVTTDGEWWRLLTCMFLHYGLMHVMFNMWALMSAGQLTEKLFGRVNFAIVYFGSGIVSGCASMVWNGDKVWSAGASGAVFGVFGALLGYMMREKHVFPRSVFQPLLKSSLAFAGYNLVFGAIVPGIDNAAHVGGFLSGIVIGWLTAMPLDMATRRKDGLLRATCGLAAVAVMITAGVLLAPRYGYKLVDEVAWYEGSKDWLEKETAIVNRQQVALREFELTGTEDKLIALLNDEAIPFFEKWHAQIVSMPLTAGRLTDRRRQALKKIVDLRLSSYRNLLTNLRARNPRSIPIYMQEELEVYEQMTKATEIK